MNANELIRKLKALGADVDTSHGKGSHVAVRLGGRLTFVPLHGKKELGPGLNPRDSPAARLRPKDLETDR